jgi:hypothetical protein
MNWKKFFALEWRKALVYFIILSLVFILPLIIFFPPACSINEECMAGFVEGLEITAVSAIPIYAVSCFYVWIYEFFKKILGRKNIKK